MAAFDVFITDMDPSGRDVDLAPSAVALPGRVRLRMPTGSGLVPCLIGVAILAFALCNLPAARGNVAYAVMIGFACLIAAGLAVFGVHTLIALQEWDFTTSSVVSRSRGILGWRTWEEPLSAYRGVVGRREYSRGAFVAQTDVLFIVELKHRGRPDRDVRLYASSRSDKFKARHAYYARLFGLPAITSTPAGDVVLQPGEVGLPLRRHPPPDWVMFAAALPKSPPGDGLVVSVADGVLTIATSRSPRQLLRQACRTGLVVGVGLTTSELPRIFFNGVFARGRWLPSGIPVVMGIYLSALLIRGDLWSGRERLMVSAERVTYERSFPWLRRTEIQADTIEEVIVVSQPGARWERAVRIAGEHGRIDFGRTLTRAEKEWVRDCVISALIA